MIPGWPYSFVAALEPGRISWTAVLDAARLGPEDDETEVTAGQVREVIARLIEAGHWQDGDAAVLVVFDAGYDVTWLGWLLADLPVEVLGRRRAGRDGPSACFVVGRGLVLVDLDNRVCVSLHLVWGRHVLVPCLPCPEPDAGGLLLGG